MGTLKRPRGGLRTTTTTTAASTATISPFWPPSGEPRAAAACSAALDLAFGRGAPVIWRAASEHSVVKTMEADLAAIHAEGFSWAMACCDRDRILAEEALQVAYVKVLEGSARFDGKSSLKTFLFGVIRTTAMEQRRRRWLSARRLTQWLTARSEPTPPVDPEEASMRSESALTLTRALERLSGRQREVLHLVFSQDLTI